MAVLIVLGAIPLAHGIPAAVMLVWLLTVAANAGIGLMGASLFFLLEVKNGQDPITWVYQYLIQIVSGIYIPLSVLPEWLRAVGQGLPQTEAFGAMRLVVLQGIFPPAAQHMVVILGIEASGLLGLGVYLMERGLRRAERLSGLGVVV
jgi:ABC-2 type transport system permease protein